MSNKIISVLWFAGCSTLIGYAMDRGYAHFAASTEPSRFLGYLAVGVSTGCAFVGMISLWRSFAKRPGPEAVPPASTRSQPDVS